MRVVSLAQTQRSPAAPSLLSEWVLYMEAESLIPGHQGPQVFLEALASSNLLWRTEQVSVNAVNTAKWGCQEY